MLDDISLYWFTDTAASSARIYWENTRAGMAGASGGRIELPMAASVFPHEIFVPPKAWAEALWPNLFYWNELDRGGHFAAFEQPKLFTDELRKAFRSRRAAPNASAICAANRRACSSGTGPLSVCPGTNSMTATY